MDLRHHISFDDLIMRSSDIKRIFFFRICGTGMGAAACLLKEKGFHVEGGDLVYAPPMSDYLKSTGIPCHNLENFDWDYLKDFDLIVVGNVVARAAEEARKIESLGIPFCSFPAALGALVLKDINVVGIAGTHGKTTTTYLLSQLFENLGFDVGYFVGGVIEGRNSAKLGDGKFFFIESDEYDSAYFEKISKFRLYCLDHLILTSLEFDHADIFTCVEDILEQFRAMIPSVSGHFLYDSSYPATLQLVNEFSQKPWSPYQFDQGLKITKMDQAGCSFTLLINGKEEAFHTNVIGKHNILNLTSGILLAIKEGISLERLRQAMGNLKMVKRRQEERGHYHQALVIDDFAHHPRAVTQTIDAIKVKYPGKRLVVVMEPNSATARSNLFQQEFAISLEGADEVVLAKPQKATTVKNAKDLDCYQIVDHLKQKNIGGSVATNLTELRGELDRLANAETLFLILSNGTCLGLWSSNFVNEMH